MGTLIDPPKRDKHGDSFLKTTVDDRQSQKLEIPNFGWLISYYFLLLATFFIFWAFLLGVPEICRW